MAVPYFLGIFAYLLVNAVVPLTTSGGWRGPADVIAMGFYLLGIVPLFGMTLLEGPLGKMRRIIRPSPKLIMNHVNNWFWQSDCARLAKHATCYQQHTET